MKKVLLSLFVMLLYGTQSIYAQIPVTDLTMNTNTVTNQILNSGTWAQQLFNLEQQATILTKTLKFVTDVSSAVRDVAYAKYLIERQVFIVNRCTYLLKRANGLDYMLYRNLESSISSFLINNNSLITLLTSTLTTRFKMNDSERLSMLMNIKSEQSQLIANLQTTDMIISTSITTKTIIDYQLVK